MTDFTYTATPTTQGALSSSYTQWLTSALQSTVANEWLGYLYLQTHPGELAKAQAIVDALKDGDFILTGLFSAANGKTATAYNEGSIADPSPSVMFTDPALAGISLDLDAIFGSETSVMQWTSGSAKNTQYHFREFFTDLEQPDGYTDTWDVVNQAPTVVAINLGHIDEDGDIVITQADLLAGAADVDLDTLTATNLSVTAGSGALADNGDGTWTFTPDPDWNGAVDFSFDVSDGTTSTPNTASLAVDPVNDAPTVSAINLGHIDEDGDIVITQADLLAGAADVDLDTLTATNLSVTAGSGALADNGDGTWTFTPDPDWNGAVDFSFDVSDGTTSTPNTASLAVDPVNDAPTADAITWGVTETDIAGNAGNVAADNQSINLLTAANADDIEGDTLSVVNGSAQLQGGGGLPPYLSVNYLTGALTINKNAAEFKSLLAGQELDLAVAYQITDGENTITNTVNLTVTGTADKHTYSGDPIVTTFTGPFNNETWDGSFTFGLTPTDAFSFSGTANVTVTGDIDNDASGTNNDETVAVTLEGGPGVTLGAFEGTPNQEPPDYSTRTGSTSFASADATISVAFNSNTAGGNNGVDGLVSIQVTVTAYDYWA